MGKTVLPTEKADRFRYYMKKIHGIDTKPILTAKIFGGRMKKKRKRRRNWQRFHKTGGSKALDEITKGKYNTFSDTIKSSGILLQFEKLYQPKNQNT